MKNILLAVIMLFSTSSLFSQDCNSYIFFQKGKTIEMTVYNKKDDVSGKQVYKVLDVSGGSGATTAKVESEMFDKKGKSIMQSTNNVKCENGMMMMDMSMNMPQSPQFKNIAASAANVFLEYPSTMNVGDQLKDASMQMDIENNGMKQNIDMQVTNRKVEAKEKVTTTAGSWDCFKITNNTKLKMKTMGVGLPTMNMENTEWYAPGFGIVKTEGKYGGTAITAIN